MKLIFLLSKENLNLAVEEVLTLVDARKHDLVENLLVLKTNQKGLEKRLAYTHRIYRFLFETNYNDVIGNMGSFDWQAIYTDNFCLRINHIDETLLTNHDKITSGKSSFTEKELAGYIWRKVKNPKVDLTHPRTAIELFFTKNKIFCGLLLHEIPKDINSRKAHLRPGFAPVSLHPRLARALVNLTGVKKGETIIDPFCGTGGILLEAGLMDIKAVGSDIDDEMLSMAKENIRFYNLKKVKLLKQDATKIVKKYDYLVTDLPYGKNTKKIDTLKLYKECLATVKKIMVKKAVVVFPDFVTYKKLLKAFKIQHEFSCYIHKSMTKKIVLFRHRK